MNNSNEKKLPLLEIVFVLSFVIILILALLNFWIWINPEENEDNNVIKYTTSYTNLSVGEAWNFINTTTENLTIIDCRGLEGCSTCQYNRGHIPGAERNDNPLTLYNYSDDILVYSVNGSVGATFCEDLVNNVYGKIFNLAGGWNAWKKHYDDYGWPPIE
jgi:rhodanese-related sulfurtransferase